MTWSWDPLFLQPNYANDQFKLPETRLTAAAKKGNILWRLSVLVNQWLKRVFLSKWPKKRQTVLLCSVCFVFCFVFFGNRASTNRFNFSLQLPGNQHRGLNCLSGGNETSPLETRTSVLWRMVKAMATRDSCWKDLGHIQQLFTICERNPKMSEIVSVTLKLFRGYKKTTLINFFLGTKRGINYSRNQLHLKLVPIIKAFHNLVWCIFFYYIKSALIVIGYIQHNFTILLF